MNATVLSPGVSSRTTTLQGLPNRALFLDRLKQALASAQRHGQRVALLFLDLDRFKEINDTQGHAIGDRALIEIARRFQAALREEETLARLAGDEFVVIAMGANQSAAALIAERILFGEIGLWLALATCALTLLIEPVAASAMTLRLYGARPLRPDEAPAIWSLLRALAARAGLPNTPVPYYVPSDIVNAFATGSRRLASIALTDGLLRSLSMRELQAVLAHEVAHIAQEDLRVMGLADSISRLTNLLALLGQVALLISIPVLLVGAAEINWIGLLLLAASPQLALLAQLGLSRVREFDADRMAVELTGDPHGLASALAKIERVSRSWRAWLLPGWGNPEPSWLRTHPATEDRIARLMALAPQPSQALPFQTEYLAPRSFAPMRPPRRGLSGLWR